MLSQMNEFPLKEGWDIDGRELIITSFNMALNHNWPVVLSLSSKPATPHVQNKQAFFALRYLREFGPQGSSTCSLWDAVVSDVRENIDRSWLCIVGNLTARQLLLRVGDTHCDQLQNRQCSYQAAAEHMTTACTVLQVIFFITIVHMSNVEPINVLLC